MKLLEVNGINKNKTLLELNLETILRSYIKDGIVTTLTKQLLDRLLFTLTSKYCRNITLNGNNDNVDAMGNGLNFIFLSNPSKYPFADESLRAYETEKDKFLSIKRNKTNVSLPSTGTYITKINDLNFIYWTFNKQKGHISDFDYELNMTFIGFNVDKQIERYIEYKSRVKKDYRVLSKSNVKKETNETIYTLSANQYIATSSKEEEKISSSQIKMNGKSYYSILIPNEQKERIKDSVNSFLALSHLFEQREWTYKMNILLTGPAGTGKTSLAKAIINQINGFVECKTSIIAGRLVRDSDIEIFILPAKALGEVISRIQQQNAESTKNKMSIYLVEEVDELMNDDDSRIALQQFLDGPNSPNNAVIICTTNYPGAIDPRIIDRFDVNEEIDVMSQQSAKILVKRFIDDRDPIEVLDGLERYMPYHINKRLKAMGINIEMKFEDYKDEIKPLHYEEVEKFCKENDIDVKRLTYHLESYVPRLVENKIKAIEVEKFVANKQRKIEIKDELVDDDNSEKEISLLPQIVCVDRCKNEEDLVSSYYMDSAKASRGNIITRYTNLSTEEIEDITKIINNAFSPIHVDTDDMLHPYDLQNQENK